MAVDTAIRLPRPLAYRNWDGTYRNLPEMALNPSDFEEYVALPYARLPRHRHAQFTLRIWLSFGSRVAAEKTGCRAPDIAAGGGPFQ